MIDEVQQIAVAAIVTGLNNRTVFKPTAINDLAASIAQHGLVQPITVRPYGSGYQLVAGERRWRAVQQLGWPTIAAHVRQLDDAAAHAVMLAENAHRADVDPIDQAHGYARAMEQFGWDERQVAHNATMGVPHVRARLGLLRLIPDAQTLVRSGALPLGHAEALMDLDTNHQHHALRVLTQSGRRPSLNEFRRICGELHAASAQADLFDLEAFYQERLAEIDAPASVRRASGLPRAAHLPRITIKRTGGEASNVGQAIKSYADQLRAAGFDAEALTITTMLDDLVASYWTTM